MIMVTIRMAASFTTRSQLRSNYYLHHIHTYVTGARKERDISQITMRRHDRPGRCTKEKMRRMVRAQFLLLDRRAQPNTFVHSKMATAHLDFCVESRPFAMYLVYLTCSCRIQTHAREIRASVHSLQNSVRGACGRLLHIVESKLWATQLLEKTMQRSNMR